MTDPKLTIDDVRHEYVTSFRAEHQQEARQAFDAWLREHDAALIEGLADEVNVKRNDPGLVHLDVRYAGYYTGIRSGLESSETLLREKARQRREEKP